MSVCWTGDATQLQRDMPEMIYVLAKEGGEIWSDFYAIPKGGFDRLRSQGIEAFRASIGLDTGD